MSVFSDLRALEQEMEDLTHKMAELDHTSTNTLKSPTATSAS